jgi:hypothetical protein
MVNSRYGTGTRTSVNMLKIGVDLNKNSVKAADF